MEMKRKKAMQHGAESKYFNLGYGYTSTENDKRRNFRTDPIDINNNFSVINHDTLRTTSTKIPEKNSSKGPLIENIVKSDMFGDGFLNLDVTPNAESFKRMRPFKAHKHKRASGEYFDKRKTTCMLYLQADHLFYEKMGRSEEACIEVMTRHVQGVNSIYRAVGQFYLPNQLQF